MFQRSTLNFLKSLAKNNNKAWFDSHRDEYLAARSDFEDFVSKLIKEVSKFDTDIKDLRLKDCIFRLNRDIRFSKDKTPYKKNFAASLDRGGKKSIFAGYYFHLQPGGKSFVAGGIWMPMGPEIKKIRQEIDYCFDEFKKIVNNKNFVKQYKALEATPDVKLNNLPRGYDKDNPAGEYLKLKSLLAIRYLPDESVLQPSLIKEVATSFKALTPLIKFINRTIE